MASLLDGERAFADGFVPQGPGGDLILGVGSGMTVDPADGTVVAAAPQTVTLPANATSFVEIVPGATTVTSNTDGFTSGSLSLYVAMTSAKDITHLFDLRGAAASSSGGGSGTPGAKWFVGAGVPSDATGVNGDFDLNSANGDVYKKAAGTWGSPAANIKGATGATGAAGAAGAKGDKGDTGASGSGSGDALVANPLSQFAATTSAQLAGVLSDETGTGVAVFGTNPTLTAATMAGALGLADNELTRPLFRDTAEKVTAQGNSGSTKTLDHEASDIHTITLTANCTLTLGNPPATGKRGYFVITETGDGTHALIYPGGVTWGSLPTPPILANGEVRTVVLVTDDAGTSYLGSYPVSADLVAITAYTSNQTAVLGNRGCLVKMNSGSANSYTLPQNSDVAFPIGSSIEVVQYGAGATTIVQGTGATVHYDSTTFASLVLAAQYASVVCTKIGTNEWFVRGGLTHA